MAVRHGARASGAAGRGGSAEGDVASSPRGLVLVIVSTLLAQGIAIYTYQHLRIGGGFYPATFAARLLVPLGVGFGLLRMRPGEMGLAWPHLSRAHWGLFGAVLFALPLLALPLLELDTYQASYTAQRHATPDFVPALWRFAAFTVSTTLPWEILHRGFLLHALRMTLQRNGLRLAAAATAAILVTQSFEVLFHFVKPPLEAIAMAFASPLLSWLAFRTRSLLLPLLLHLEVEILFFLVVLR